MVFNCNQYGKFLTYFTFLSFWNIYLDILRTYLKLATFEVLSSSLWLQC
jgi:hypothetical protein